MKFIILQKMKTKLFLILFLMSMVTVGHAQGGISKIYNERNIYEQIDSLSSMSMMDTTQNLDTLQQTPHKKSPALGVLLSVLYPGAGQLYLGQHKGRGAVMFTVSSLFYVSFLYEVVHVQNPNDDLPDGAAITTVLLFFPFAATYLWSFVDILISANSLANQQHEALTWNLDKHKKSKLSITPDILTSNLTKVKTPVYGLSLKLNF